MTGSTGGERGAVAVLAVVVVGMILLLGVASLDINAVVSARNRSQTAADAAALAVTPATFTVASTPREAARRMAAATGARLVWCRCQVDRRSVVRIVSVRTEVVTRLWLWDDIKIFAQSRAEFTPYPGTNE